MVKANNYLLDTHVLIWWLENNPKLSREGYDLINNGENNIYISSATIWEISIKSSLNKLKIASNYLDILRKNNFLDLNINFTHTVNVENLPYHHHDPFDRMLITQAKIENLTIITHDQKFSRYDVLVAMV